MALPVFNLYHGHAVECVTFCKEVAHLCSMVLKHVAA